MRISRFVRPLARRRAVQRAVSWLLASYVGFVYRTTRWTFVGFEEREALAESGERFLIMLWHNRLAMMPVSFNTRKWRLTILTSKHRDGQLVRGLFERFRIASIAVGSRDADVSAAREVARAVRDGSFIGVTPDGPRGPRMRVKPHLVSLARLCNARVTFMTYSVRRRLVLGSWDRFIVPLPFNEGVFIWSRGFQLPRKLGEADTEAWCRTLEEGLSRLTEEADRMMGHEPMQPAAADEPVKGLKGRRRAAQPAL